MSTCALAGTGATIGVVDYFAGDLPSIDAIQTANLIQTTRIVDRNGSLIEALYHENRTVVPLSKISVTLQKATIATEDRTFYDNSGVDYRRLAIAVVFDLTHRSAPQGGSTITQQVVKNDVLDTEEAQSRTVSRKFRELLLAEEMERRYTKQQILELYLNTINYGNGAYGAEAAAETYFHVHASGLTWAQASFLAGLPQAPSDFDPFGTPDELAAARTRWGEILAMVGSADYNNASIRGQINLTGMDPLGWRGVGSSFKVYTYAAALQAGLVTPASLLNDQSGVIGGRTFSDWDGKHEGYISMRTALAQSRNLPALWTYSQEGGDRVVSLLHSLGVSAQIENPEGVATTLGHDAISMAEHLAAYSAFDNGGYRVTPTAVLRITDANGRVLEAFDPNFGHVQVITPELGYVMTDLLRGPVKLYLGDLGRRAVAGKSGTTEAYTGSIFIGYTPNLAVAASLMHINDGPKCSSGYAYLATNFPPSGWQCPTSVLFGENVGISVWKPFLEEYYSRHTWPALWAQPAGVVTRQVCTYDGGYVASGGYNEIFLKGVAEPRYPCGANPYPGEQPYVPPAPPAPAPSPSPH